MSEGVVCAGEVAAAEARESGMQPETAPPWEPIHRRWPSDKFQENVTSFVSRSQRNPLLIVENDRMRDVRHTDNRLGKFAYVNKPKAVESWRGTSVRRSVVSDAEQLRITQSDLDLARAMMFDLDPDRFAVGKVWPFAWHRQGDA
jgi:hypothetical protein